MKRKIFGTSLVGLLGAIIDEILSGYITWIIEPNEMEYPFTFEDDLALLSIQNVIKYSGNQGSNVIPHLEVNLVDRKNLRFVIYNSCNKDSNEYGFEGTYSWFHELYEETYRLSSYEWGYGESIDVFEELCYDIAEDTLKKVGSCECDGWEEYLKNLYSNLLELREAFICITDKQVKIPKAKNFLDNLIEYFELFNNFDDDEYDYKWD